ncbi:hypothetical protein LMH87_004024 [Akanthomyces muscarius]|uniref:Uncharacterized protein n=1 Tax=Akanthomyces muscarius TaxID=2231603 RepID=A0A9W8Q4F4_AKAMU|nr:hypothetical protein LMH87_004024 [Akanthomyces muscarius]KAJ4145166.1 hypothetical protein LMH87_004024 [Akanthomyces muscarius]
MTGTSSTEKAVEMTRPEPAMFTSQPTRHQAMDPQQAHAETADTQNADPELGLRGGGETCPGRFCFIIPCPIPCNFCIFPCPC